jgi:hypothetical protein
MYDFDMSRSLEELKAKSFRYRVLGIFSLLAGALSLYIGSTQTRRECYGACSTMDWFNANGNPNNVWVTVQEGGVASAIGWILVALGIWAVTLGVYFNSLLKSSSSIIEGLAKPNQASASTSQPHQGSYCTNCGSRKTTTFCGDCGAS